MDNFFPFILNQQFSFLVGVLLKSIGVGIILFLIISIHAKYSLKTSVISSLVVSVILCVGLFSLGFNSYENYSKIRSENESLKYELTLQKTLDEKILKFLDVNLNVAIDK